MKPVVTRLYAVLVFLALVGLIAWSTADWFQRERQAQAHTQSVLRQAAGILSDLSIRQRELGTASLNAVFAKTTGTESRWKMVLLSSPERGTEYYRGPRPTVSVDQAVPRWQPRDLSEVKVSLPVFRAQGDPMVLEGIYEFYGRTEVFSLLKACGLTLALLVILTSGMVYFATRREDPPSVAQEGAPPFEDEAFEAESDASLDTLDLGPPPESSDEYWFDETLSMEDLPPLEDMPALEEMPAPDADANELTFEEVTDAEPSLFSPATGMGWESFLKSRLDHELQRCAGQNQDLSLVLFAFKEGGITQETWGQTVREAFPSVDLDFEFEGGAAVILPGRNLEEALKAARAFVESSSRMGTTVHAGVASRAGRLLPAETLVAEAGSAKRRSLAGTVRVLGLKTDPDRYRDHLAGLSTAG